ncbi:MAG: fused MFS/spermidine synthase [Rhodospirillaceae bacterium]|nr:fused MFS/spermidine synthase [Rhodospirillaceae bacterium]
MIHTKPTRRSHRKIAAKLGVVKLVRRSKTGALVYAQRGGNQTATDREGISLDAYIHALFALVLGSTAKRVLMIGCAGGTLATMLHRAGRKVTVVDIDPSAFAIARKHFKMPRAVRCRTGDGLVYLQTTRARFDAVVIDAFIGERVPEHFTGDEFCAAARRALTRHGAVLVNFCLDTTRDLAADRLARRFKHHRWTVRVLDEGGGERNAIVCAGHVKHLRRPRLIMPPEFDSDRLGRELTTWKFRRVAPRHRLRSGAQHHGGSS